MYAPIIFHYPNAANAGGLIVSASPATTTLHRTPLHPYAPSNSLYTGPDLNFNEEVDLGLELDSEAPAGANDSFSGPSGRDFDIPLAQPDDYDIGLNFEGFGEARPDEEYVDTLEKRPKR